MIVVRHGAQYELTLQAETLAVSGAALPKPDDDGLSRPRSKDRPDRQPPPPGRDPRPAVRCVSPPPNRDRLDRRAGPDPPLAPGRVIVPRHYRTGCAIEKYRPSRAASFNKIRIIQRIGSNASAHTMRPCAKRADHGDRILVIDADCLREKARCSGSLEPPCLP